MRLQLISKSKDTTDTWHFLFAPESPTAWLPGQSIRLEVPGEYGFEEKRFTIVTAPHEGTIGIATRFSDSDFKQALAKLQPGESVSGYAIEGDFLWQPTKTRPLLIAGGIGITPYIAMLKDLAHRQAEVRADLWHSYRTDNPPCHEAISAITANLPGLAVRPVRVGRITAELLLSEYSDATDRLIYLSGPNAMVEALYSGLVEHGVPSANILTDYFSGRIGWESE